MRKLISLLVVLGMLFVASSAFGWGMVNVDGSATQINTYVIDHGSNFAGGYNITTGAYEAAGFFLAGGVATADGQTRAVVNYGCNSRSAIAYTHGESAALAGALGTTGTSVDGEGFVEHGTYLPGNTGGSTYGSAGFTYGASNSGYLLSYSQGSGTAITGGTVTRNWIPNGVVAHAVSGSFAMASAN